MKCMRKITIGALLVAALLGVLSTSEAGGAAHDGPASLIHEGATIPLVAGSLSASSSSSEGSSGASSEAPEAPPSLPPFFSIFY